MSRPCRRHSRSYRSRCSVMSVEELIEAGAAGERVAESAADRFAAVAQKDPIIPSAVDEAVIAVQHRQGWREALAGRSLDQDALIARRRRIIARAGRIDDDFEVELAGNRRRSEEHTSELQSRFDLVCRLLLEKKKNSGPRTPAIPAAPVIPSFIRSTSSRRS